MTFHLGLHSDKGSAAWFGPVQEPSLTSPENLIQLAFLVSFPSYVKVLTAPLAETGAPWGSSSLLLLQRSRATRTTNIIIIISFRKGSNNRFEESAGTKSGESRIREAGEPGLRPLLLKGKSPQSASGPGEEFCRGRGSSGLPGGHFSVT